MEPDEPSSVPEPYQYAQRLRQRIAEATLELNGLQIPAHLMNPSEFRRPSELKDKGYPRPQIVEAMRTAERTITRCVEEIRRLTAQHETP